MPGVGILLRSCAKGHTALQSRNVRVEVDALRQQVRMTELRRNSAPELAEKWRQPGRQHAASAPLSINKQVQRLTQPQSRPELLRPHPQQGERPCSIRAERMSLTKQARGSLNVAVQQSSSSLRGGGGGGLKGQLAAGTSAASFAAARALLVKGDASEKATLDHNEIARDTARASHDLRASLNLDRSVPHAAQALLEQVRLRHTTPFELANAFLPVTHYWASSEVALEFAD